MKSRTLVIGDIHGANKALLQVLQRADFNPEKDRLICLGDETDGWSESAQVVETLIGIKNKAEFCKNGNDPIFIRGNHDVWTHDYLHYGITPLMWTQQGGQATVESYIQSGLLVEESHRKFFRNQVDYYLDEENRLFIHGGWDWRWGSLEKSLQDKVNAGTLAKTVHWDRSLFETALSRFENGMKPVTNKDMDSSNPFRKALAQYKEIYIGHTARDKGPIQVLNIINMDSGAGWYGKLSIMDIDTKEIWQSDLVMDLYPDEKGRR